MWRVDLATWVLGVVAVLCMCLDLAALVGGIIAIVIIASIIVSIIAITISITIVIIASAAFPPQGLAAAATREQTGAWRHGAKAGR